MNDKVLANTKNSVSSDEKQRQKQRQARLREKKRQEGHEGYRKLSRLRASCGDILFYPQLETPTCWFAATINATIYSEGVRKVIISKLLSRQQLSRENKRDWPLLHAALPILDSKDERSRETLLKALHFMLFDMHKIESNDPAEWKTNVFRPEFLISLFHRISPRQFPVKPDEENRFKPCGGNGAGYVSQIFIPRFLKVLGIDDEDIRVYSSSGELLNAANKSRIKLDGDVASETIDRFHESTSYDKATRRENDNSTKKEKPPIFKSFKTGEKFVLDSFVARGGPNKVGHVVAGVTCRGHKYVVDSSTPRPTIPNPKPLHTSVWRSDKFRTYPKEDTLYIFYNATRYGNATSEHRLPPSIWYKLYRISDNPERDLQTVRYSGKGLQPVKEANRAPR